jgi:hypothetical protein
MQWLAHMHSRASEHVEKNAATEVRTTGVEGDGGSGVKVVP